MRGDMSAFHHDQRKLLEIIERLSLKNGGYFDWEEAKNTLVGEITGATEEELWDALSMREGRLVALEQRGYIKVDRFPDNRVSRASLTIDGRKRLEELEDMRWSPWFRRTLSALSRGLVTSIVVPIIVAGGTAWLIKLMGWA